MPRPRVVNRAGDVVGDGDRKKWWVKSGSDSQSWKQRCSAYNFIPTPKNGGDLFPEEGLDRLKTQVHLSVSPASFLTLGRPTHTSLRCSTSKISMLPTSAPSTPEPRGSPKAGIGEHPFPLMTLFGYCQIPLLAALGTNKVSGKKNATFSCWERQKFLCFMYILSSLKEKKKKTRKITSNPICEGFVFIHLGVFASKVHLLPEQFPLDDHVTSYPGLNILSDVNAVLIY